VPTVVWSPKKFNQVEIMGIAHFEKRGVTAAAKMGTGGQITGERKPIDIRVGRRLGTKRLERGLRQDDLANLIHVPVASIQAYEEGEQRIAPSHLMQFSSLLGVSLAFFFPEP
jgi:ribosome-binding protein aMBF1 (putative translation factor)